MYIGWLLPDDDRLPRRHVTLTFHNHDETKWQYHGAVKSLAAAALTWQSEAIQTIPLAFGKLNIFEPSGAWHVEVESEKLKSFQSLLAASLQWNGVPFSTEFDYVPHMTLAYFDKPKKNPFEGLTFMAESFTVVSKKFGNTEIKI